MTKTAEATDRQNDFKSKLSEFLGKWNAELWSENGITIYFGKDTIDDVEFHSAKLCDKGFGYYHEISESAVFEEPKSYEQELYDDHFGTGGEPR